MIGFRSHLVALTLLGIALGVASSGEAQGLKIVIPQIKVSSGGNLLVKEDASFFINPDPAADVNPASLRLRLIRMTKAGMDSLARQPHSPDDTCVTFYNTFVYKLAKVENNTQQFWIGFATNYSWLRLDQSTKVFHSESYVVVLEEKAPGESDQLNQPLRLLRSAIPDYLRFAVELRIQPSQSGPRAIVFKYPDPGAAAARLPCLGVTIKSASTASPAEGFLTACESLAQSAVSGWALSDGGW